MIDQNAINLLKNKYGYRWSDYELWQMDDLHKMAQSIKNKKSEKEIFRDLISKYSRKMLYKYMVVENSYILDNNKLIFNLEDMSWKECPKSIYYLYYLRRFFVPHIFRNSGVASRFIEQIKSFCESSGCIVGLIASNYGLKESFYNEGEFYTGSLEEAIELDVLGNMEHFDVNQQYIENFYIINGFTRCRILDPDLLNYKGEPYSLDQQFAYLPSSLSVLNRLEISHRLL